MMKNTFNLEHLYQNYLKMVQLKESDMGDVQRTEMKRMYMGACGQLLILLRDSVSQLEETEAIEALQSMLNQVSNFFNESIKQN